MTQDANPMIDRLCQAFPACFDRAAPKPLKIGLGPELLALAGVHPALADLSRTQLRRALEVYTGAPAYQQALAQGGPRYGLDGQAAGEVTPAQQALARQPRPPATAPEPGPEPSPATGYLKMSLKRRLETKRAGLPGGGAEGPPSPEGPPCHPQPPE